MNNNIFAFDENDKLMTIFSCDCTNDANDDKCEL